MLPSIHDHEFGRKRQDEDETAQDDFDDTLNKLKAGIDNDLLNRILNGTDDPEDASNRHKESAVHHLDDAIDYSDFHELAEETPVEHFFSQGMKVLNKSQAPARQLSMVGNDDAVGKSIERRSSKDRLRELFPAFDLQSVPRFSELFKPKIGYKRRLHSRTTIHAPREDDLVIASDQSFKFQGGSEDRSSDQVIQIQDRKDFSQVNDDDELFIQQDVTLSNTDLEAWDDVEKMSIPSDAVKVSSNDFPVYGQDFSKLYLNMNDSKMLFELVVKDNDRASGPPRKKRQLQRVRHVGIFDLSGDRFYEVRKDGRLRRIRQTFGNLVIRHSLPAVKLQSPFYKPKLTKVEARSFHRPPTQFLANFPLHFARVKGYKKRKTHGKEPTDLLRKTKDLSFRENAPYVLLEYSEEHPPVLSNFGMGSLLVNYYRKVGEDDSHIPKMDLGEPFVLDVADASPFMNFGHVESGQTVTALYNNMVRAPLFRHKPKATDFLLVKSTTRNDTRYYLRKLQNAFVVGQTYPITEVPGPHSRKISTIVKNRLQVTTFRLIRKTPHQRLKMGKLSRIFTDQNDMQIRQRLKEFMEYQRKGGNSGYWQLKPGIAVPSDNELRKLVTPEMVCLSESMQVGQRHLLDAGYGKTEDEDNEGDESKLDVEQQLAPWITTRNFINATQGKAMLKLHGEGDPSGAGLAFSFIRVSMKDIFLRAGESAEEKLAEIEARPKSAHRYNVAEQQQVYREEISRIWNAQHADLSNSEEPELEDDASDIGSENHSQIDPDTRVKLETSFGEDFASPSPSMARGFTPDDDDMSMSGRRFVPYGSNKVLKIRRLVRTEGGIEWQTETVRDTAVINAYVRNRQMIEDQTMSEEILEPTNDDAKNRRRQRIIEEQLARLKRNAERRLARRNAKAQRHHLLSSNGPFAHVKNGGAKRSDTVRRCGNCGQLGHMKTNRQKCPMWQKMEGGGTGGNSSGIVKEEDGQDELAV